MLWRSGSRLVRAAAFSSNAAAAPLSHAAPFTANAESVVGGGRNGVLLPGDAIVSTPSFELTRTLFSRFVQSAYSIAAEKNFTTESLLIGANNGLSLLCDHVSAGNWERAAALSTQELTELLRQAQADASPSLLSAMRFSPDQVVHSFLYSSLVSGRKVFKFEGSGNVFLYFAIVSFIRISQNVPFGLSPAKYLSKHRKDLLVANITYARPLNPMGPWKVTALNVSL